MLMRRERRRTFTLRDGTVVVYERKGDIQSRLIVYPDGRSESDAFLLTPLTCGPTTLQVIADESAKLSAKLRALCN